MRKHLTGGQPEKELAPLIGQRVSVRLHDGDGSYRDLLGELASPDSIRKKNGEIVFFNPAKVAALRVVVDSDFRAGTGAPLSMRIRDLEIAASKTWPSNSVEIFGQWQIRISKGFSYRANSVLPIGVAPFGEPPLELPESVAYVISKYLEHKLDPVFHVSLPVHQELDDYLAKNGWESPFEILVMVGDTRELIFIEHNGKIIEASKLTQSWLDLQGDQSVNEILEGYPSKFIELQIANKAVAVGRLSIADGWGILTRIFVAGVLIGAASVLVHNLWPPFGLIFVILAIFVGIRLVGKTWGGRAVRIFATFGWTLVVTRAGTIGNGDEILILGNNIGNFFIFLGLISAILATLAKA